MTVSMIRGKWEDSQHDPATGCWRRVWVPCFVLKVDYNPGHSPTEYAMIAVNADPYDRAGGMIIKKVPTHEIRLLRQRIPL